MMTVTRTKHIVIALILIVQAASISGRTISIRVVHEESFTVEDIYEKDVVEMNQDLEIDGVSETNINLDTKNWSIVHGDNLTYIPGDKVPGNVLQGSNSSSSESTGLLKTLMRHFSDQSKHHVHIGNHSHQSLTDGYGHNIPLHQGIQPEDEVDNLQQKQDTHKFEIAQLLLKLGKRHHRVRRKFSVDSMVNKDWESIDTTMLRPFEDSMPSTTLPVHTSSHSKHKTTTDFNQQFQIEEDEESQRLHKDKRWEVYKFIAVTSASVAGFCLIAYCFVSDPKTCIVAFGTGCPCCLLCPCLVNALKKYSNPQMMMRNNMNKFIPGMLIHENGKVEQYDPTPEELVQLSELISEITDM